jgi:hypothetical protein
MAIEERLLMGCSGQNGVEAGDEAAEGTGGS